MPITLNSPFKHPREGQLVFVVLPRSEVNILCTWNQAEGFHRYHWLPNFKDVAAPDDLHLVKYTEIMGWFPATEQ